MKKGHILWVLLLMLVAACGPKKPGETTDEATTDSASTSPPMTPSERIVLISAMQAVVWGMPAVNADLTFQAYKSNGGDFNQVAYWSNLLDWKNQTLTPNPGTIYFMPFVNLKDGPMVLEVPAAGEEGSITGNICDFWQCALEDAGPAGADKGKGGKYLLIPPEYYGHVPAGYIPLYSDTYENYALLRSILKSTNPEDIAKAVAYGKKVRLYPLSQAHNPPATTFSDMQGKLFDANITYDMRYFQSLNRIVQTEPWQQRDRAFIDVLNTFGIKKGHPFNPDSATMKILTEAVHKSNQWLDHHIKEIFPQFYEGEQWFFPAIASVIKGQSDFYADTNEYPISARAVTYSMGYIGIKHLGAGQYYLYAITDKNAHPLHSDSTYHLKVPANAPVQQYWSATLYDRKTHALIRNAKNYSISSQTPGIIKNADGSVDLYFGPKAPDGKDANWVDSGPSKNFEVLMRFYAPEKPLFDQTWKLPDIERMK
ncbi:MAG TPA: DUF1254 domain-containing protein [Mucilaginibacter sp.]|jgi:hypothetical protein